MPNPYYTKFDDKNMLAEKRVFCSISSSRTYNDTIQDEMIFTATDGSQRMDIRPRVVAIHN